MQGWRNVNVRSIPSFVLCNGRDNHSGVCVDIPKIVRKTIKDIRIYEAKYGFDRYLRYHKFYRRAVEKRYRNGGK